MCALVLGLSALLSQPFNLVKNALKKDRFRGLFHGLLDLIVDPPVLHALPTARLYLLCFAYHRFHQINDNLIGTFIHLIAQYEKQAKLAADGAVQKAMTEASAQLQAAGQVLNLFIDQSIPDVLNSQEESVFPARTRALSTRVRLQSL